MELCTGLNNGCVTILVKVFVVLARNSVKDIFNCPKKMSADFLMHQQWLFGATFNAGL
jgi:hypothetical protein